MTAAVRKSIIVTDLDGTLLDDAYRWQPAEPCIGRLRELGFPLVLNSSKTLPELRAIAVAIPTHAPLVAENGGLIAIPEDSPLVEVCETDEVSHGYRLNFPGLSRRMILQVAHKLRDRKGYAFEGFADWSVNEIIGHTGLSPGQALDAGERKATEPIHWHDSEENFAAFCVELAEHGIRVLRGGRFFHLMGQSDKAGGLRVVLDLYRKAFPDVDWSTIALGDGPNDLEMLNAADIAVVIPSLHGGPLLEPDTAEVRVAPMPGPAGWNDSLSLLLTNILQ